MGLNSGDSEKQKRWALNIKNKTPTTYRLK